VSVVRIYLVVRKYGRRQEGPWIILCKYYFSMLCCHIINFLCAGMKGVQ
jgi:hypothetical protein